MRPGQVVPGWRRPRPVDDWRLLAPAHGPQQATGGTPRSAPTQDHKNGMIQHTFCHLPGVAARTEQRIWASGLTTWAGALGGFALPAALARRLPSDLLLESARRHAQADPAWF